jgi:pyridoxine/pyridoxamine 5'-phosphate oxidase
MDLLALAKSELLRSNADSRHPFRFFYLATQGVYPEVRTVVKRDFSSLDWSVLFYTDARTPKVQQMRQAPEVSALFYHPKKQLQLRLKGEVELIGPGHKAYSDYIEKVKQSPAVKDYNSLQPPGTEIAGHESPGSGEELHFLAIRIRPVLLDILQLGKEQHLRMAYSREQEQWVSKRLVP